MKIQETCEEYDQLEDLAAGRAFRFVGATKLPGSHKMTDIFIVLHVSDSYLPVSRRETDPAKKVAIVNLRNGNLAYFSGTRNVQLLPNATILTEGC